MSEWDEDLVEATLRDHDEPTYDWRDEHICLHDETPEWPCAELRLARIAADLRAQLAQREGELEALRERMAESRWLFARRQKDANEKHDELCKRDPRTAQVRESMNFWSGMGAAFADALAALSDNQEAT